MSFTKAQRIFRKKMISLMTEVLDSVLPILPSFPSQTEPQIMDLLGTTLMSFGLGMRKAAGLRSRAELLAAVTSQLDDLAKAEAIASRVVSLQAYKESRVSKC